MKTLSSKFTGFNAHHQPKMRTYLHVLLHQSLKRFIACCNKKKTHQRGTTGNSVKGVRVENGIDDLTPNQK